MESSRLCEIQDYGKVRRCHNTVNIRYRTARSWIDYCGCSEKKSARICWMVVGSLPIISIMLSTEAVFKWPLLQTGALKCTQCTRNMMCQEVPLARRRASETASALQLQTATARHRFGAERKASTKVQLKKPSKEITGGQGFTLEIIRRLAHTYDKGDLRVGSR